MFVLCISKWWLTDNKLTTDLTLSFHVNEIYKILTSKSYGRMKKATTMSRRYDPEIWYVWLLGCFNIDFKKLPLDISENTDLFSKYRPNTDQF